MSAVAIRALFTLLRANFQQASADALYELLLGAAEVHVPFQSAKPHFIRGPNGQLALPVFLDEEAMLRWSDYAGTSSACTIVHAARLTHLVSDAWLVLDLGSSPGDFPIAREGVERLAQGTFPGAERYDDRHAMASDLANARRTGVLPTEVRQRAETCTFFAIGSWATPPSDSGPAGEVAPIHHLSVRGPDGRSYMAAWPAPGGAVAFMPNAETRLFLPIAELFRVALATQRGLVIGLNYASPLVFTAEQVVTLWRA